MSKFSRMTFTLDTGHVLKTITCFLINQYLKFNIKTFEYNNNSVIVVDHQPYSR